MYTHNAECINNNIIYVDLYITTIVCLFFVDIRLFVEGGSWFHSAS